ncbi:hypothetical protein RRU01S_27_00570 [Agrobacterium rubi TR3 = NBRC 13261]|uniref:Uncharacterized protein n=1 Tax=Agrobacterium rubi TR3 = NBRC 13261 TaxID=1368415 RepID=A0A081D173_9HYPH|nr:hypothetical protein RRU01S_27_00570 [Agrobacterium rubi TR3 = NBRC 13261]
MSCHNALPTSELTTSCRSTSPAKHREHNKQIRTTTRDLIFYRVDNEKVVIIHILYGATDYGTILFGE